MELFVTVSKQNLYLMIIHAYFLDLFFVIKALREIPNLRRYLLTSPALTSIPNCLEMAPTNRVELVTPFVVSTVSYFSIHLMIRLINYIPYRNSHNYLKIVVNYLIYLFEMFFSINGFIFLPVTIDNSPHHLLDYKNLISDTTFYSYKTNSYRDTWYGIFWKRLFQYLNNLDIRISMFPKVKYLSIELTVVIFPIMLGHYSIFKSFKFFLWSFNYK